MSIPVFLALIFSAAAALCDLKSKKIPNRLSLAAYAAGLCMWLYFRGARGLLVWFAGAAVVFLPAFLIWQLGGLGAGDVKLLSALTGILSPGRGLRVCLLAGLLCLVFNLFFLFRRGQSKDFFKNLSGSLQRLYLFRVWELKESTGCSFALYVLGAVILWALWEGRWFL